MCVCVFVQCVCVCVCWTDCDSQVKLKKSPGPTAPDLHGNGRDAPLTQLLARSVARSLVRPVQSSSQSPGPGRDRVRL